MKLSYQNCYCPLSGQTGFTVERGRFVPSAHGAERRDLKGAFVLPAFLDPHSHLLSFAISLLQADASRCNSAKELFDLLRRFEKEEALSPSDFLTARDVRPERLEGGKFPTREEMDRAFPDRPVLLQHPSGHSGAFNSAALRAIGDTPDGDGFFEETQFISRARRVPLPDFPRIKEAFDRAQEIYLSRGACTAQEGLLTAEMLPLYRQLVREGLRMDVVGYASPEDYDAYAAVFPDSVRGYSRSFRLGGVKIFLDGSPQSKTAFLREPYTDGTNGAPTMTENEILSACRFALARGAQLLAHCNGDGAAQMFLDALARFSPEERKRIRPVMIHAQILGEDQLVRIAQMSVIPSFFVSHVFHWGDTHLKNLGETRARFLSPAREAAKLGIPFTLHQDSPVAPPDLWQAIACAVLRMTSSGKKLSGQEISVRQALLSVTKNAALQYGEADKGEISVGKRADFILVDRNPLTCPPEELERIRVVAVYREGECVFSEKT